MKKLKTWNFWVSLALTLLAILTGGGEGIMMAAAAELPDAGKTESGEGNVGKKGSDGINETITQNGDGIMTETGGRENGDDDFYVKDVDDKLTKIRPMSTPIDQISRKAKASTTKSFEVKYYSVGTRPIETTLKTAVTKQTTGSSMMINVEDPTMFSKDDTIRVVGVKAVTKEDGTAYKAGDKQTPDLVLCVCGRDASTNNPIVYAVNGEKNASGQAILLPAININTKLIRMGKACGELDVQTGRFANYPEADIQYCQNFMMQIEQSTFDKIAAKEVDWSFTDLEEDGVFDMRLTQELTFLFGDKRKVKHISKESMLQWFTGGVFWMAGNDITLGTWNSEKQRTVITDDDLVDFHTDAFVGEGTGNKRKILFAGSEVVASFGKIDSSRWEHVGTYKKWDLEFEEWKTGFGTVLLMHHELFDKCGMADQGFLLDPEYLYKRTHLSWGRNVLDLKKAGVRDTNAVVLKEVCCLYLRYPKAHARVKLDKA